MNRTLVALMCLAATVLAVATSEPRAEEKVLNFYNWSDYMPDSVLKQFTKETGIKVTASTFDSNETLYSKIKTLKGKAYDVVMPSTYFVSRMRKEGLLLKLDKSKIPNSKNLDPKLLDQRHDPGNEYSLPYLWGTTGIVLNTKHFQPETVKRWKDLWDPGFKGTLMLLDDVRDVFSMALRTLGYSINDTNEDHIKQAYLLLKELVPNVKIYNSETPKVFLIDEEVTAGMTWNGEAFKAKRENPNIVYVYPEEGAMLWMDNLAIPAGAKHVENAYRFIDYLLRPEVAKVICEQIGYATPNTEARKLLTKETLENRMIYPTESELSKTEIQNDVGEAVMIYEKYWQMLKLGR
jgi:spermidine/putrescine transport system substrate-binding protein